MAEMEERSEQDERTLVVERLRSLATGFSLTLNTRLGNWLDSIANEVERHFDLLSREVAEEVHQRATDGWRYAGNLLAVGHAVASRGEGELSDEARCFGEAMGRAYEDGRRAGLDGAQRGDTPYQSFQKPRAVAWESGRSEAVPTLKRSRKERDRAERQYEGGEQ